MADFDPVSYMMGQKAGGGEGGSSTLAGLTDVDISNPTDGQTLVYDAETQKWVNAAPSGGFLMVGINPETEALDKTWNEIASAPLAFLRFVEPGEDGDMITTGIVGSVSYNILGTDTYDVLILLSGIVTGYEGMSQSMYCSPTQIAASASTPNDYPVVSNFMDSITQLGQLTNVQLISPVNPGAPLEYNSALAAWTNGAGSANT